MRPLSERRGISLVELLVVVTLWGLLLPAIGALQVAAARLVLAGQRSLRSERDLTTITALLTGAVTGAARADIDARSDSALFDLPLATLRSCGGGGSVLLVMVPADGLMRVPAAGRDQVLVLIATAPPRWERRTVTGLASGTCPLGKAALRLDLDRPVCAAWRVRIVTPVRLRSYESAGRLWLGLEDRLGRATIQPIAGPNAGRIHFALASGRLTTTVESGQPQRFATLLSTWP